VKPLFAKAIEFIGVLCTAILVSTGAVTLAFYEYKALFHNVPIDRVSWDYVDGYSEIACGSNSMGLTLRCGDRAYTEGVGPNDKLWLGRIYIYHHTNKSNTVHRLVYCIDSDCNQSVFKGDNNLVGELVNRSQIISEVLSVEYR
jgi:hypothetical protein